MARLHWIGALVAGLAGSGLALAQQSSMFQPRTTPAQERFMTVREDGHAPQRCKLLKTWREASGATAYQVQAVDTGELMTIIESNSAQRNTESERARAMLTQIFRWGGENRPPDHAVTPPPDATVLGTPTSPRKPIVATAPPIAFPAMAQPATPAHTAQEPQPTLSAAPTPQPAPSRFTAITPVAPAPPSVQQPRPAPAPKVAAREDAPIIIRSTPQPTTPPTMPTIVATPTARSEPKPTPPVETPRIIQTPVASKPTPASQPAIRPPAASLPAASPSVAAKPPAASQPAASPSVASRQPAAATPSAPASAAPPHLVPVAPGTTGTTASPSSCDCCSPAPCNACCPPCDACCPPSCVCGPCCQPRQSLLSRIFRRNPPCTVIVCDPAPCTPAAPAAAPVPPPAPAPKVATAPARPSDWRESWGKVEPWKQTEQAKAPVRMDPPAQPDPVKAPDWYQGLAQKEKPARSKVAEKTVPFDTPVRYRPSLAKAPPVVKQPARPPETESAPSPVQPRGRTVDLSANEGNAFWTPPPAAPVQAPQPPKYNAFERDPNSPPRPPAGSAPPLTGFSMGRPPSPPAGPMPMLPSPPRPYTPVMADSGVPTGMANAFTVAGTRRPIPADFGGTPQEPNGFGDPVPNMPAPGPGVPPRAGMLPPMPGMPGMPGMGMPGMGMPGMGMPGYPRPPMPNMMGMAPRGPRMAVNPLMAVPPSALQTAAPAAPPSVPQIMATLKESPLPSQREVAAEQLSELNWRTQPQVVDGLTKAAREDPAATVRAACVRALAHMKVNTIDVATVVQELKNDRDPRVRQEADSALEVLGVAAAPRSDSGVQRASHK
jgi:hypothetical protein